MSAKAKANKNSIPDSIALTDDLKRLAEVKALLKSIANQKKKADVSAKLPKVLEFAGTTFDREFKTLKSFVNFVAKLDSRKGKKAIRLTDEMRGEIKRLKAESLNHAAIAAKVEARSDGVSPLIAILGGPAVCNCGPGMELRAERRRTKDRHRPEAANHSSGAQSVNRGAPEYGASRRRARLSLATDLAIGGLTPLPPQTAGLKTATHCLGSGAWASLWTRLLKKPGNGRRTLPPSWSIALSSRNTGVSRPSVRPHGRRLPRAVRRRSITVRRNWCPDTKSARASVESSDGEAARISPRSRRGECRGCGVLRKYQR